MRLPHPKETLAGCVWLPRHIAKVRLHLSHGLPLSYRVALGSSIGVDGYFFRHFGLSLERMVAVVRKSQSNADIATWFGGRPEGTGESIARWNRLAETLGARGHPGHVTFAIVKWLFYPKAIAQPVGSIFEAIAQDENLTPPP